MENKAFNTFIIIGSIVIMVVCIGLHCIYHDAADALISIIGSVASLAGITVAIWQIHSLKSQTDAVSKALKDAREDMSSLTIFAEINKYSQFINEIEQYIRESKYREALITYKDLKEKLTVLSGYIKSKKDYSDEYRELKFLVDSAGGDIKTINAIVINVKSTQSLFDKESITNNLEKIKTFLDNTAGTLKGKKI